MHIGKAEKTSRPERHVGEARNAHDFADVVEPKPEQAVRDVKYNEMRAWRSQAAAGRGSLPVRPKPGQPSAAPLVGFA